ncbi:TPA: hypothetical protein DIS56_02510 [Candidatus Saccharibacteria bacterium]|nr:MAG: hypothetical protein A3F05_03710 [Candidatus Saccharibacteria bacterium RIFCSPHIGHO2_12_FULL_47_17]HCM51982.1 hypothetical protein [Candidatus Saccharibacteria bacterium]
MSRGVGQVRIAQDWQTLEALTIQLAAKIVDYSQKHKLKFSKVLVIPKGGYFLGLLLPEMLGFNNDQLIHTCVQTYVQGAGKQTGSLILGPMPTEADIKGQDILIVDEVWDTGMTLDFVVRYLKDRGSKTITIAVLHYKPGKSRIKNKKPDIYVKMTDAWIDYAWETARIKGKQPISVSRQTKPSRIFKLDPPPPVDID